MKRKKRTRPRRQIALVLLAICLSTTLSTTLGGTARAATCDASLQPVADHDGYREREGNRCEGLYMSPVAGAAMDIVSLTLGEFPQPNRPDKLAPTADVRLSVPAARNETSHIRAVGIPIGLYYRMDSEVPPGVPLHWPAGAILNNRNIPLDEVGVFAFTRNSLGQPVFLPVAIGEVIDAKAKPVAVLQSASVIEDAVWRFVTAGESSAGRWQPASVSGDRLVITLPVVAGGGNGSLELAWTSASTGQRQVAHFEIRY